MANIRKFWSKQRNQLIAAGGITGVLAALMTNWGNPPNRGIGVTCFIRDTTGAIGLHQATAAQYIRPEIPGFVLGALFTALAFKEFRPRGGSSPMVRFFLGFFVMIGAQVFLGCNTMVLVRLGGGDLNALTGLIGLVAGIFAGVLFLKRGFSLGNNHATRPFASFVIPFFMVVLLILVILHPSFISFSTLGAASLHAGVLISILVGIAIGFWAQRSRLCFMAGWRNIFLINNYDFFAGIGAFLLAILVTNYAAGNFGPNGFYHWGYTNEPFAVNNQLWNFLSMVLVGLGTALLGGCPLRQTILSGEGDTDAGIAVLGLFAGAPIAQNFLIKSNADVNTYGPLAVIIGLVLCVLLGFTMREKA